MNRTLPTVKNPHNVAVLGALVTLSAAYAAFGQIPSNYSLPSTRATQPVPAEVAEAITTIKEGRARLSSSVLESSALHVPSSERASLTHPSSPRSSEEGELQSYVVKPRDTLAGIFKSFGAPSIGASLVAEAWKKEGVPLKSLRPGDELKLRVMDGEIIELRRQLSNGDEITVLGNSRDGYAAELKKVQVVEISRTLSGVISTSFAASAQAHSVPYEIVDSLVDLFGSRIEFARDLQPGDSFSITYTERRNRDSGDELSPGELSAAIVTTRGQMLGAVRHIGTDGTPRYYNERGDVMGDQFLRYPVQFTRISSVFSGARFHPVLKRSRPHNGVDFAAPVGTPVRAVADGVVLDAGYRGGAGNLIKLAHGDRYSTAYLHLAKILPHVRPGTRVTRGQVIGTVGQTGLATGPHLHFSLFDRGKYINPLGTSLPVIQKHQERIPQHILVTALDTLRNSQRMLAASTKSTSAL